MCVGRSSFVGVLVHFASLHRPPDAAHWMAEVSPIACQRCLDVFCFVCVRGHKTPRSSSSGLFCFLCVNCLNLSRFCQKPQSMLRFFRKAEEFAAANVVGDLQAFLPLPQELAQQKSLAGTTSVRGNNANHHTVSQPVGQNGDHAQTQRFIGSAMKHCTEIR